jgi:hypothetical protein
VLAAKRAQQPHAAAVHILVFVDQDVVVGVAESVPDRFIVLQEQYWHANEVAEIDRLPVALDALIQVVDLRHLDGFAGSLYFGLSRSTLCHLLRQPQIGYGVDHFIFRA